MSQSKKDITRKPCDPDKESSVFIIAPQSKNALITATKRRQYRQGHKQKVYIVDPWKIIGLPGSCFNPLAWFQSDNPDISENAMMLADSIVRPQSERSEDEFRNEEAKALLMGILLYVALDPAEQDNRTLGRVRDIVTTSEEIFMDMMERLAASTNAVV